MKAQPRFHTAASGAPNRLAEISAVADAVGFPLLPWVVRAVEVSTEVEDGHEPVRRTALWTVPRQSSKSTGAMCWMIDAGTRKPDQYGILMAQNRLAATNRLKDLTKMLLRAGIEHKSTFGAGNERCVLGNGTVIQVLPPTENAAHGESVDFALLDEVAFLPEIVLEGVYPAMAARPEAMLLFTSTAGTLAGSPLLNRITAEGREDPDGEMVIVDYGVPEGVHPLDEDHWHEWHPGLGYTVGVKHLRAEAKRMKLGQWTRAYGNVPTAQTEEVIPSAWWEQAEAVVAVPDEITLAIDASAFGGSIAAVFTTDKGYHMDLVEWRPGDDWSWLMPRVRELVDQKQVQAVALDSQGPISYLAAQLKQLADDRVTAFRSMTTNDRAKASHFTYDQLREGALTHSKLQALDDSVESIGSQTVGDLWRFSRSRTVGDPGPIIAGSMALLAHNEVEQSPKPALHVV